MIGNGVLFWDRIERVTRRYGYIYLVTPGESILSSHHSSVRLCVPDDLQHSYGRLCAIAKTANDVKKPGDLALGRHPIKPEIGERLILGTGRLAVGQTLVRNHPTVGLVPVPFREYDWLDSSALWKGVGQEVELYFEPLPEP